MGGLLSIIHNRVLTTIGASFGTIQSTGPLEWYNNGGQTSSTSTQGSRSFCASARAVLCPAANQRYGNNEWADNADYCCTAYCATTTDC